MLRCRFPSTCRCLRECVSERAKLKITKGKVILGCNCVCFFIHSSFLPLCPLHSHCLLSALSRVVGIDGVKVFVVWTSLVRSTCVRPICRDQVLLATTDLMTTKPCHLIQICVFSHRELFFLLHNLSSRTNLYKNADFFLKMTAHLWDVCETDKMRSLLPRSNHLQAARGGEE